MKPFLLNRQLEDQESSKAKVTGDKKTPNVEASSSSLLLSSAHELILDSCKCPHLERWLPTTPLDLTTIPNERGNAYQLKNPIHAMYLEAHLEDGEEGRIGTTTNTRILYGEEQQRLEAHAMNGLSDSYYTTVAPPYKSIPPPCCTKWKVFEPPVKQQKKEQQPGGRTVPSASVKPKRETSMAVVGSTSTKPTAAKLSTNVIEKVNPAPTTKNQPTAGAMKPSRPSITSTATQMHPPTVVSSSLTVPTATTSMVGAMKPKPIIPGGGTPLLPPSQPTPTVTSSSTTAMMPPPPTKTGPATNPLPVVVSSSSPKQTNTTTTSDPSLLAFRQAENKILLMRQTYFSKRKKRKAKGSDKTVTTTSTTSSMTTTSLSSSRSSSAASNNKSRGGRNTLRLKGSVEVVDQDRWEQEACRARTVTENWLDRFRQSRMTYFNHSTGSSTCQQCSRTASKKNRKKGAARSWSGDDLMQCLECSFVGCATPSTTPQARNHMGMHMAMTNHNFAVTCGKMAAIYCFACGDYVQPSHPVFDQETERCRVAHEFPQLAWEPYPIQRSFDAFRFSSTPHHHGGVVWRGMIPTYPSLVPEKYLQICRLLLSRKSIMTGSSSCNLLESTLSMSSQSLELALMTCANKDSAKDTTYWSKIAKPVGFYNLGNTCFMASVLQCLIHCEPLQRYFLQQVGHDHRSCRKLRRPSQPPPDNNKSKREKGRENNPSNSPTSKKTSTSKAKGATNKLSSSSICLACELDILLLKYLGSSIGKDVLGSMNQPPNPMEHYAPPSQASAKDHGVPLIPSDLLSAAWRSGQMDHLVGYEQRDCHEFLQAFLDIVGIGMNKLDGQLMELRWKHEPEGKPRIKKEKKNNMIQQLFEGHLRSVSICERCSNKRSQLEAFLNISLPLHKQQPHAGSSSGGGSSTRKMMSVQHCLSQFTMLERLGDKIDCPVCKEKTSTKKQHTFAKLPKILCLHLKRFNAATNKKITDFVSFPAKGLDLGPLLPHWSEVVIVGKDGEQQEKDQTQQQQPSPSVDGPHVYYDLISTVNHKGTLNQGHYVSNVKIGRDHNDASWYHCNDAHVYHSTEKEVLQSDGAYVLFYMRR